MLLTALGLVVAPSSSLAESGKKPAQAQKAPPPKAKGNTPLPGPVATGRAAPSVPHSTKPRGPTAKAATAPMGRNGISMQYASYVKSWHSPDPHRPPTLDCTGKAALVLVTLNTGERAELLATTRDGGFSARDLDRAAHVLREPSTGNQHPVEPRILDTLYRIQTHFGAQEIRVLSGYRTPRRGQSNHGRGRAVDFILPGYSDETVAQFARTMGFVGVGIYPTSGFVHVDVRDRSYFWVDASGPGRRNRERGILGDLAVQSDREALAKGLRGLGPLFMGTDVDAALQARGLSGPTGSVPGSAADTDDDDHLDD